MSEMNVFSVAPMIDWTDRHCRFFHRILSQNASLYTEMIVDQAVLHGDRARLLDADAAKENVVLQLGGSDPDNLSEAVKIARDYGYQDINFNCGCPSDRVQAGVFGAVLMFEPRKVAHILESMRKASDATISLKCRLGVDEQEVERTLPEFLKIVSGSGIEQVTIHARKAWLKGLSPKENRVIPPLDYDLAWQMKSDFPSLKIALNGGLSTLSEAKSQLDRGFDAVMLGRAAYQQPYDTLAFLDAELYGQERQVTREEVIAQMTDYLVDYVAQGGQVHSVTRHMLGLFHAQPGGRIWRQILSHRAKDNDPQILNIAYGEILNYA